MRADHTVSRYLVTRLQEIGIGHVFGVPGDYVLDLLDEVAAGPLQWVGTCNELNAGYAADGYARLNGAGAAVVTYGVGGLSILNALAGAYAEQVPLILISGAPPGPAPAGRRPGPPPRLGLLPAARHLQEDDRRRGHPHGPEDRARRDRPRAR